MGVLVVGSFCELSKNFHHEGYDSCWEQIEIEIRKDLFIKNRSRTAVKLLLFCFDFLWIRLNHHFHGSAVEPNY